MNKEDTIPEVPLLKVCVEKLIKEWQAEDKQSTARNYQSTWNKLSNYLGKSVNHFTLNDITAEFVQQYLFWLMQNGDCSDDNKKLKASSLDFYLRNLKSIYRKIIKDYPIYETKENPFANLNIKVPPSRKRALPSSYLQSLTTLEHPDNPYICSSLHLALFLFYARGMCFIDVFHLQQSDIHENYIHYIRSKTGVALQIKITPEMREIMATYHLHDSPWVFPFLHEKQHGEGELTAQSALRRVNRHLKMLGKKLQFHQPFTTYVMRHSWASMMLEANSEIAVISQSLGHMSLRTTEIYLGRLSSSKMDQASDNMLNHLVRTPSLFIQNRNRRKRRLNSCKIAKASQPQAEVNKAEETIKTKCKNFFASILSKVQLILS